jgi:NTE family protein
MKAARLRVGVVLGGGGVTGLAYHAGALTAIEHDLGWDVRTAEVIVGTSAGSIAAGLLRGGVPASDLAARGVGIEPISSPPELSEGLATPPDLPSFGLRSLLRFPRIPHPALFLGAMRAPWRVDLLTTMMGLLSDGSLDVTEHQSELQRVVGDGWPVRTTLICAVRQRDLRRVTFGRDVRPSIADAIAASCAVPGYFSPVQIEGVRYVDGGLHSPTNATALCRHDLDLAIICSPMSTREAAPIGPAAWARRYAGAKLRREVEALQRRQIPAVVLEPGRDLTDLMGFDFMDHAKTKDIVSASLLDAGEQLRRPLVRTLVEGLAAPMSRSRVVPFGDAAPDSSLVPIRTRGAPAASVDPQTLSQGRNATRP